MKKRLDKSDLGIFKPSEKEIDAEIDAAINITIGLIFIAIIVDFVFRYLVIETLYQKYKYNVVSKPNQIV